jgi:hypothetical protein
LIIIRGGCKRGFTKTGHLFVGLSVEFLIRILLPFHPIALVRFKECRASSLPLFHKVNNMVDFTFAVTHLVLEEAG